LSRRIKEKGGEKKFAAPVAGGGKPATLSTSEPIFQEKEGKKVRYQEGGF